VFCSNVMILLAPNSSVEIGISLLYLNNGIKEKGKGKRNRTNKWKFNMMKMKSSKGNWTGRKGQLFLHLFLKYIYAYVNKSILKLNICVRLSVSVLLHYNCKINANIQGVYHRPKLERACNVGCRLFSY